MMIIVVILTIVVFAIAMTCLAIGVIVRGRSLQGHCGGGTKPLGPNGESLSCHDCTCENQQVISPESIKFHEG